MNKKIKIGILTSGGDCPGLNALIAAVTIGGIKRDYEILGIKHGFTGLFDQSKTMLLTEQIVESISSRGGSILGTSNNVDPFHVLEKKHPRDRSKEIINNINKLKLDALLVAGGDGSLSICHQLSQSGVPIIGIPKTIDNDVYGTDLTIGFQTAVQSALKASEAINDSGMSHRRIMLVETMGRSTGWIALYTGVALLADVILIPEIPYSLEKLSSFLKNKHKKEDESSLIIVAEGIATNWTGASLKLKQELDKRLKISIRSNVLGHIQRGGHPLSQDRLFAHECGIFALDLVKDKKFNKYIISNNGDLSCADLFNGSRRTRLISQDDPMIKTAKEIGIYFGN